MGGYQISGRGPGDDGYDEDGYDESQRAEILEVTRDGPNDGVLLTDLNPDLGDDPDELDVEDELSLAADDAVVDEESADDPDDA